VDEGVSVESYGGPDADAEALRKVFQEGSIVHLYADQARTACSRCWNGSS
jgi:hypothetical protein